MIVIVGMPCFATVTRGVVAEGLASRIARAAAATGASVQLVGKVGDDPAGDAVLVDLARAGVGHAALLRDPANATRAVPTPAAPPGESGDGRDTDPDDLLEAASLLVEPEAPPEAAPSVVAPVTGSSLEPADLELGLRYLVEFGVVVTVEQLEPMAAAVVVDAAAYAGAHVVALTPPGVEVAPALADATVLEIPPDDPDDAFARLVGAYAVALDDGTEPGEAFRMAAEGSGWERALP